MSVAGEDQAAAKKREVAKNIKESFALFDKDSKGMCDVREIGTIVRHLGICPTEIELREMITEIEEEEPTGFIRFEKFERMMSRILLENQYPRDPEDKLLRLRKDKQVLYPKAQRVCAEGVNLPGRLIWTVRPRIALADRSTW